MSDKLRKTLGPIIDRWHAKNLAKRVKSRKPLGIEMRGEELESRAMLAGHGFEAAFAQPAFFAAAAVPLASIAAHNDFFGQLGSSSDSSSSKFSASLTDSAGDTATLTFQTGNLLGVSEAMITVTGDTVAAGTSVTVAINGTNVGTVAINSSGTGTLVVPSSSLTTTIAAGSTVTLGTLSGTFAASTTTNPGNGGGCGNSSAGSEFSAAITDTAGDTATVTYQTGSLLGVSAAVVTVTGDKSAEGTSVPVTIGGTSVGSIAISSTGTGTLLLETSTLASAVAAGSTVTVGGLSGSFGAASTSSSAHSGFTAPVSDSSGNNATVTYQIGKLLGTSDTVITVTGDTLAEGTSVSLVINGVTVGTIAINSSGTGTLIVPTSSISTTVAAGSTVSVGTLSGTFAASPSTSSGSSGYGHDHFFGRFER